MSDSLHDYLKKHKPPVPPAPRDEWQRIVARTQAKASSRPPRVWYYLSAATLAAAGLLAFVKFAPQPQESDAFLEPEDLVYQLEASERGAYQDWLLIADQVADEADSAELNPRMGL